MIAPEIVVRDIVMAALKSRIAHPEYHAALTSDASLSADLGLTQIDLWGVACAIEEALGFRFDGDPELHWHTPADIVASIEQVRA